MGKICYKSFFPLQMNLFVQLGVDYSSMIIGMDFCFVFVVTEL